MDAEQLRQMVGFSAEDAAALDAMASRAVLDEMPRAARVMAVAANVTVPTLAPTGDLPAVCILIDAEGQPHTLHQDAQYDLMQQVGFWCVYALAIDAQEAVFGSMAWTSEARSADDVRALFESGLPVAARADAREMVLVSSVTADGAESWGRPIERTTDGPRFTSGWLPLAQIEVETPVLAQLRRALDVNRSSGHDDPSEGSEEADHAEE